MYLYEKYYKTPWKYAFNLSKSQEIANDMVSTKEGTTKCSNVQYRAVSRGTYRLSVTGKIYNSSGTFIESGTAYSLTITY